MTILFSTAIAFVATLMWSGSVSHVSHVAGRAGPPPSPKFSAPKGDVLFADDFKDGNLKGWITDRDNVWHVQGGVLRAELPDQRQQRSLIYAGDEDWKDYAVDLDVCQIRGVDKGVVVRAKGDNGIGVDLRGPGYHDLVLYRSQWPLGKASVANGNSVWHHLRIEAREEQFRVYVNGEMVLEKRDGRRSHPAGRIALPAYTGGIGECTVYYDNVVVTAL
jgi:hypothetical protein